MWDLEMVEHLTPSNSCQAWSRSRSFPSQSFENCSRSQFFLDCREAILYAISSTDIDLMVMQNGALHKVSEYNAKYRDRASRQVSVIWTPLAFREHSGRCLCFPRRVDLFSINLCSQDLSNNVGLPGLHAIAVESGVLRQIPIHHMACNEVSGGGSRLLLSTFQAGRNGTACI